MPIPEIVGDIGGALVGAAGSYFSGKSSEDFAKESAKKHWKWEVKSLKDAGLNPMLSVMKGAPAVQTPDYPNIGEGAMKGFSAVQQARMMKLQNDVARATEQDTVQSARGKKLANDILEATPEYQDAADTVTKTGAIGRGATSSRRVELEFKTKEAEINRIAEQTLGHSLSNDQLVKIQPILVEIERLREKGMNADLIEKQVNAEWFKMMGSSDKYGPFLKFLIMTIGRFAK